MSALEAELDALMGELDTAVAEADSRGAADLAAAAAASNPPPKRQPPPLPKRGGGAFAKRGAGAGPNRRGPPPVRRLGAPPSVPPARGSPPSVPPARGSPSNSFRGSPRGAPPVRRGPGPKRPVNGVGGGGFRGGAAAAAAGRGEVVSAPNPVSGPIGAGAGLTASGNSGGGGGAAAGGGSAAADSFAKQQFTERVQAGTYDATIQENARLELMWDQDQAVQWLENALNRSFADASGRRHTLHAVLRDGTVLCELLAVVRPDDSHAHPRYHQRPAVPSQMIENIAFFRDCYDSLNFKGHGRDTFSASDVFEGKNMKNTVAALEAFMRTNRQVWVKATEKMEVKMQISAPNGDRILDMEVTEATPVRDIKQKMMEKHQVAQEDAPKYGMFLVPQAKQQQAIAQRQQQDEALRAHRRAVAELDTADLGEEGVGTYNEESEFREHARHQDEVETTNDHVWLEEGATVGEFFDYMEDAGSNVAFQRMNDRVTDLLQTTIQEGVLNEIAKAKEEEDRADEHAGGAAAAAAGAAPQYETDVPALLEGDAVLLFFPRISHLHHHNQAVTGDLFVTRYQLVFTVRPLSQQTVVQHSQCAQRGFRVPLASVQRLSKLAGVTKALGKFYSFDVKCKDMNEMKFAYLIGDDTPTARAQAASGGGGLNRRRQRTITAKNLSEMKAAGEIGGDDGSTRSLPDALLRTHASRSDEPLSDLLEKFVYPKAGRNLFAFANEADSSGTAAGALGDDLGWGLFDMEREFKRLGVPDQFWRFTRINEDFKQSDTYPQLLCVPAAFPDKSLPKMFKFRSRGRIPVLCWISPTTGAPLLRCSQPAVGLRNRSCNEDREFFRAVSKAHPGGSARPVFIVDARPKLNAMANKVAGKGYEKGYENCQLHFVGIENIHKMRDAENKLRKICNSDESEDVKYIKIADRKKVEWLNHIQLILEGACQISVLLNKAAAPVVIHCSDGWDRTAQLSSLAELILDPYYRTIQGFQVLIEKEWLAFGHKFDDRVGHTKIREKKSERAPIFLQFMDGVWQLHNQFGTAFEFNAYFLRVICMHLFSCCFGTFLFNNEKERQQFKVRQNTVSLWSHINFHRADFANEHYTPHEGPLCSSVFFDMELWADYYLYWNRYHRG